MNKETWQSHSCLPQSAENIFAEATGKRVLHLKRKESLSSSTMSMSLSLSFSSFLRENKCWEFILFSSYPKACSWNSPSDLVEGTLLDKDIFINSWARWYLTILRQSNWSHESMSYRPIQSIAHWWATGWSRNANTLSSS